MWGVSSTSRSVRPCPPLPADFFENLLAFLSGEELPRGRGMSWTLKELLAVEPCDRGGVEAVSDMEEVLCELSSTTPEDFQPFTWIPGREAGLKKLAAPPKWGVASSFHFNSVSEPTERHKHSPKTPAFPSWSWRQQVAIQYTVCCWKLETQEVVTGG